jgi:hypothetical protein
MKLRILSVIVGVAALAASCGLCRSALADDKNTPLPTPAEEKPIELNDLPDPDGFSEPFRGDPYVKAAMTLQKLGKDRAISLP